MSGEQKKAEYIIPVPTSDFGPFNIMLAGITYESPDYHIKRTSSVHSVTEYIISGSGHVIINDTHYTVSKGDMYILPFNSNHEYYSDPRDPWRKIWINTGGSFTDELLSLYGLSNTFVFKNADGYRYLSEILKLCESTTLSGYEINKCASEIYFSLVCYLAECENKRHSAVSRDAERLKVYIDRNVDKNISLAELSELIFRSESQVIRIFKGAYGQTPYDYLLSRKLERATLFLQNTSMSVHEIAMRLGFYDEHYFSNVYKKKTGRSPSSERKAASSL